MVPVFIPNHDSACARMFRQARHIIVIALAGAVTEFDRRAMKKSFAFDIGRIKICQARRKFAIVIRRVLVKPQAYLP